MPKFQPGNPYGRRFKPGQSGNPRGRPPRKAAFDALVEYVEEQGATRAISEMWLARMLAGDYQFFREYLDRRDGKVVRSTRPN